MNKLLLEVSLPAADISYDLSVPDDMKLGTFSVLVATAFTKLSNGLYRAGENVVLCDQKTGKEYDLNLRIHEADIKNGTKFFLY